MNSILVPRLIMIIGDFKTHNTIWVSTHTTVRGSLLKELFEGYDMLLQNTGEKTRLNAYNGNLSAFDLAYCDPTDFLILTWTSKY